MTGPDIELVVTAPDHTLTMTYRGRTWDLLAYALDDFGTWEAVAHERGTDGPALPAAEWGVTQPLLSPSQALAALTGAILRRTKPVEINWDSVQMIDNETGAGMFDDPVEEDGDGTT